MYTLLFIPSSQLHNSVALDIIVCEITFVYGRERKQAASTEVQENILHASAVVAADGEKSLEIADHDLKTEIESFSSASSLIATTVFCRSARMKASNDNKEN